jgi:UDP-N-acetylglucosamine 2-epimerase (non-hydrolysing)
VFGQQPAQASCAELCRISEVIVLKVSVIFGTRPEAIKLAPLILAIRKNPAFECEVCVTAQHRQMLDQVLETFGIQADIDLNLMQPNQSLAGLTARAIEALDRHLGVKRPEMVLVQGDTTTAFAASLAAFYQKVPLGHVEAGLRTGNMMSPWPEEANRVLTSRLASLHFCPTEGNGQNLLREGVRSDRIYITGNTIVDALFLALDLLKRKRVEFPGLPAGDLDALGSAPMVLITGHRRENFGAGFEQICVAIAELASRFSDVHFIYPVHLNPNVREPVYRVLRQGCGDSKSSAEASRALRNLHLIEPLSYLPFVALMDRATLILTDSGGIQEEALSLGKPVLVMRDTTERREGTENGAVKLVGTSKDTIVSEVSALLASTSPSAPTSRMLSPYGDGRAAERIVLACRTFLEKM